MDPDRKREIINAEERFTVRERLNRALAEKGIYVLGRLTHDAQALSLLADHEKISTGQQRDGATPVTETLTFSAERSGFES